MPRSNAAATAGGMLNDLKSRLGFSSKDDDRDAGYGDIDDFGEYDDFDADGFNARDDREYAGYGADYDETAPVGGYRPATTRSSRFGRPGSTPDLVSIDDVKSHTQVADDTPRTRQANGRDLVSASGPAQSSPAYNAQVRERSSRSEGLDSLFEPTGSGSTRTGGYDPYGAYSATSSSSYSAARGLTVVRPASYADAEQVTRALKAGDVVVLAMRSTPDDLTKRILDFAFGAASALDASVESPAEAVFAIACGRALDEGERARLRTQGVL